MEKRFYSIRALTKMHVGDGKLEYNIVDNQVQRDEVTGYPCINGSSLKGSLRVFAKEQSKDNKVFLDDIFGSENGIGSFRFFDASLLSIPVRSELESYYPALSLTIIKNLIEMLEQLDIQETLRNSLEKFYDAYCHTLNNPVLLLDGEIDNEKYKNTQKVWVEDEEIDIQRINFDETIKRIIGNRCVLYPEHKFKEIITNLPIIARNKLDNGKSKNLWYEEIVPKFTQFYTFFLVEENPENAEFEGMLNHEVVQIGANETIGYGYCTMQNVGDRDE